MRIGFGYDSHRLVAGRRLILGGVEIPHEKGLLGHSDADALVHAVCDAILGAIGADDMGKHFPNTDKTFKDISSLELLSIVRVLTEKKGFVINNIDSTIILERPKLMAYTNKMASNIADCLLISTGIVSIKAKTNEGMGFVGQGEGAAAFCVVTVEEKTGPGNCRVRFAPSPTGSLHVGNARTALFNWLFARQNGGVFILRIEDTDQERSAKNFEQNLLEDLRWLGIGWDEGPEIGGPYGPYNQSERLDIYKLYLDKLIDEGRAYPCYCSEKELEAERISLAAKHMMPRYSGACRQLSPEDRQRLENAGKLPAYRYKVEDGPIEFEDLIRGAMKFDGSAIGDFVIMRSNGLPAYNFAVVVDDHLMGITHVIRGEDHLSNTAVQALLYRALGFKSPLFAHHSLILGKDRTKLSKRHGSVSVREFRERGFLPEVLLNYLALLGNSLGEGREVCDISEIIKIFILEKTGKSGAIFDENKLRWLNGIHIKKYPQEKLAQSLMPFIRETGYYDENTIEFQPLMSIINVAHENMRTLAEIKDYLKLFNDNKYELSPEAKEFLSGDDSMQMVKIFHNILISDEMPEKDFYAQAIKKAQISTGKKGRSLFLPIRCAVTGMMWGPELDKIIEVLGKQSVIKRLEKAIQALV